MCELVVVTNRKLCKEDFLDRIRLLCEVGVDKIVLREKDLSEWEYQKLAKNVLEICKGYDTKCILHHFVYSAVKLHADGIHMSVPIAMRHWKVARDIPVVGVSTHSVDQIYLAHACHADYVFFGHVFATSCKPGEEPRGISMLEEVCRKSLLPVYAIGGMSPENVYQVLDAGAVGICVMSWGMTASIIEMSTMVKICHEYQKLPSIITKEIYDKLPKKRLESGKK